MKKKPDLLGIIQEALGTFDHRQSFSPGMFEPLKPLFEKLGYRDVAIYITDDYPDRMHVVSGIGKKKRFPPYVAINQLDSLPEEFAAMTRKIPGIMTEPLFSHSRLLGMIAATHDDANDQSVREAFSVLAKTLSVMAYVEHIRTNSHRERQERDIFFAQSLTNRFLLREPPKMRELRLGFKFIRALEAGGDFFDLVPDAEGGLYGFIGSCNGQGLRTVLEVSSIIRSIHRVRASSHSLSDTIAAVNDLLIREQHRAHQASLAIFRIDAAARKLRLAKAGRLGILLCGPGKHINDISSPGTTFLGMVEPSYLMDEEYEFAPGQALFAFTEGFYSSHNILKARPQFHWFLESVAEIYSGKPKKPLANAVFDTVNHDVDHTVRPDSSMLSVSIEFKGRRDSIRMPRDERRGETVRMRRLS